MRTLYRRWIGNSLYGRKRVAHDGKDFCTYAERPDGWAGSTMCVPRRSHGAMFALGSRCARNEESLKQRSGH